MVKPQTIPQLIDHETSIGEMDHLGLIYKNSKSRGSYACLGCVVELQPSSSDLGRRSFLHHIFQDPVERSSADLCAKLPVEHFNFLKKLRLSGEGYGFKNEDTLRIFIHRLGLKKKAKTKKRT